MIITFLCSDPLHPVNDYLLNWAEQQAGKHQVNIVRKVKQIKGGDILFMVSCSEVVHSNERSKYKACLILHASDLPKGRGWSPHIWDLINGAASITLTLLEAEDKVDSGKVWHKVQIIVPKHALWDEINHLLFLSEIQLIDYAVQNFEKILPTEQLHTENATYYPRRTPKDSALDPNKSIAELFNLIRVCDPNRFPAYFEYLGERYILKIEKSDEQ